MALLLQVCYYTPVFGRCINVVIVLLDFSQINLMKSAKHLLLGFSVLIRTESKIFNR